MIARDRLLIRQKAASVKRQRSKVKGRGLSTFDFLTFDLPFPFLRDMQQEGSPL